MFRSKRILYLGSISLLVLSSLMFIAHTKLAPTAHAASCNTVATGDWSNNCQVSEGNISNFVYGIQQAINVSGDGCSALTVDGDFGPATKTGVKCFQAVANFPTNEQDGIVGQMTWGAMYTTVHGIFDGSNGGWDYYNGDTFRKWHSTGVWYVFVPRDSEWCQMNLDSPC